MPDENIKPKITPAIKNALEKWDSLPRNERSYKKVAAMLNITEGRAADYVRKGLIASDRADETPRGASGNGGGTRVKAVSDFEQQLKDLVDQNRAVADELTTQINEAQEAASNFDPDEFRKAEGERREKALAEAQAALTAWQENTDDVAEKAAAAEQTRLTERAERLLEANEKEIATASKAAEQAEAMLATLTEQDEGDGDEAGDEAEQPAEA